MCLEPDEEVFHEIGAQGFGPRYVGSKPTVLPLDETPVDSEGLEPSIPGCRPGVFPTIPTAQTGHVGIEPTASRFGDERRAITTYDLKWSE
jgi:hypothetical protein